MNILVTGYKGFVGNALVGRLKKSGHKIIGLDYSEKPEESLKHKAHISVKGDVRDFDLLKKIIVEHEIEEIYHLASWAINGVCANDPLTTFEVNLMGMVNILEVCRNYGKNVKNVIISTSDKAFGASKVPYTEENELKPLFTYDTSKACQQLIALGYFRNYDVPIKIVACSNIYGPGDLHFSRVIPATINRLLKGQPARLWADSEGHVREFVYIDDVINAFLIVAQKGEHGGVYCCGGTEYLAIKELMVKICLIMKKNPKKEIKVFNRPVFMKELAEQYIDASKIGKLGWKPKVSLTEGLKETIKFHKKLLRK